MEIFLVVVLLVIAGLIGLVIHRGEGNWDKCERRVKATLTITELLSEYNVNRFGFNNKYKSKTIKITNAIVKGIKQSKDKQKYYIVLTCNEDFQYKEVMVFPYRNSALKELNINDTVAAIGAFFAPGTILGNLVADQGEPDAEDGSIILLSSVFRKY